MFYEYRPTILVLFGLLSAQLLEPSYGRIAGSILVLAGVLIFNFRLNHRSKK